MAEDLQQPENDLLLLPSMRHQGSDDGAHTKQSTPTQLSKEKLYQQRQRSELKRLLKHTHPELKMLDDVVDEELTEVLSLESGVTPVDSTYEGEVLLRRLIFEKCSLSDKVSSYTPMVHLAGGAVGPSDNSKSTVFEEPYEENVNRMLDLNPDHKTEGVDEVHGTDVKSSRRIFERQPVTTSSPSPNTMLQEDFIPADKTGPVQKQKQEVEISAKDNLGFPTNGQSVDHEYSEDQECIKVTSTGQTVFGGASANVPDPESTGEFIKTSTALFQNNPFISANIEQENSCAYRLKCQDSVAVKDCLTANVKNRAHLFDSMPFDKIRQQNKEEIQTMVENIKETLNSLYCSNVIHSGGTIIEVNETMIARKAKFILSENGPKVKHDELAEGGAQNFIHHELPRANLKPQVTYLKENSTGNMEATVVKVPVHHHHITANHGAEFKTANVVQLIENILNQDNSLRKGVIIQEDVNKRVEVIVYSIYNYVDEADVKSYSPPQDHAAEINVPELERGEETKGDTTGISNGHVRSTISCLLETSQEQSCSGSVSPEVMLKGNVKLFKACIERGDLQCMKSLWAEPPMQEQELSPIQHAKIHSAELCHEHGVDKAQGDLEFHLECPPVDVKRLKNIFSASQSQPKHTAFEDHVKSPVNSHPFTDHSAPLAKYESSHEQENNIFRSCGNKAHEEALWFSHPETLDENRIHQDGLLEAGDNDDDERRNCQSTIQSYSRNPTETKAYQNSVQEKMKLSSVQSSRESVSVVVCEPVQKDKVCDELIQDEHSLVPKITSGNKSESQHLCTERSCPYGQKAVDGFFGEKDKSGTQIAQKPDSDTAGLSSSVALVSQQKDMELIHGKRQAALDALERCSVNVSRGDFTAAMIYRNSSQSLKQTSQNVAGDATPKLTREAFNPVAKQKPSTPLKQEVATQEATVANTEHPNNRQTQAKPTISKTSRRPLGPKPTIPPKPQHLTVKHKDDQSNIENPKKIQTSTMTHEIKQEDKPPETSIGYQVQINPQIQGSFAIIGRQIKDIATAEVRCLEGKNENETSDTLLDCHEACQKFQGERACSVRNVPLKPKRLKMNIQTTEHASADYNSRISTHPEQTPITVPLCDHSNISGENAQSNSKEREGGMREKKGENETEDEHQLQLSVHMEEFIQGNRPAAVEIFDNLQKQEELQSILTRGKETEQDATRADIRSLRAVFENAPACVVNNKKETQVKLEKRDDISPSWKDYAENKVSMAHVFGDLEKATMEIMNLKEQTVARLVDIEEAIKNALYTVSTLRSDSDIAGLSYLVESLRTTQGSSSLGSQSRIGSSTTKTVQAQESQSLQESVPRGKSASAERISINPPVSPPSSPSFISIQSAARKPDQTDQTG
ncbi:xin actin-binding repeat-containing protein 1-like isoform X2 [Thalassophryne amazonica]|uniref:xin actin-binding repeat-containing protein 1-like isoform X2 n=1 Tax=Thalassophryne amazonica TaxID=390379 RepID=UPI0014709120|nr:xin actin-binding repeat-containing protein 1-like isoform X2 [Thalassophryne amazonica]